MSHMHQVVEIGVAWGHMKAYYPSIFPLLAFSTKDMEGRLSWLSFCQGSPSSSQELGIGPAAVGGPE